MGAKAAELKMSVRPHYGENRKIDNPYTHLAASIIIQAYEDLKALKGQD